MTPSQQASTPRFQIRSAFSSATEKWRMIWENQTEINRPNSRLSRVSNLAFASDNRGFGTPHLLHHLSMGHEFLLYFGSCKKPKIASPVDSPTILHQIQQIKVRKHTRHDGSSRNRTSPHNNSRSNNNRTGSLKLGKSTTNLWSQLQGLVQHPLCRQAKKARLGATKDHQMSSRKVSTHWVYPKPME